MDFNLTDEQIVPPGAVGRFASAMIGRRFNQRR